MIKRMLSLILALVMILTLGSPLAAFADGPANTFNGNTIPFSDWVSCGYGTWTQDAGVLRPASVTEYSMLRFNTALGQEYTVDMDVRQLDTTSGWQTIQIGFDVNAGHNFTQSGLVLDLHNAGVARVITYADKDKTDGTIGSYGNPYGGNGAYTGTTDWFHVKIVREGNNYTGGYLVLGSVGNQEVNYKNVQITTARGNTFHMEDIPFANWSRAGIGAWTETNGILKPTEITEYSMLRLDTALGQNYTIDMDVKQLDTTSGWQTIQIGFDVNAGENFTQSGLVLDLHNAGVARVITYADKDKTDSTLGSYNNPYGGNGAYTGTSTWFHVRIARVGSNYTVKVKNTTLTFAASGYNGGCLVLGSVGNREVNYKNVQITKTIPFADWTQAGAGAWTETNGVLQPAAMSENSTLRLNAALGAYYTVDMDVRQLDTSSGWNTVQIGFDVNAGENFTQSGLVLDLHNAGVARVITYADKDKTDGTLGSYNNPYDSGAYTGTTDWFHVTITRAGGSYAVTVKDTTLAFETDDFNSGYLVLGSVGNREVDYKNVAVSIDHCYVDGVCENCGKEDPNAPAVKIKSACLRINEDINMIYTAKIAASCEYPYMVFNYQGRNYTVSDYTVSDAGLYCFELPKIEPQGMGDSITATVYATQNGATVSDTVAEYSVRKYCVDLLENTEDAVLIALLSDLLTYGAAAQTYTGHNTNSLVTSGLELTPSTFSAISGKAVAFGGTDSESVDWIDARLILSNMLAIRLSFFAESTEGLTVTAAINGRSQTFDEDDFGEGGNGTYYVDFHNIKATEFDEDVAASFALNGEPCGRTVTYSVNTYVCDTQNDENTSLRTLVRALYNYGVSAAAYSGLSGNIYADVLPDIEPEELISFRYGGQPSADILNNWTKNTTYEDTDSGTVQQVTWTDPAAGLQVLLTITRFDDTGTVEWVARLKNTGNRNTSLIEDFRIADLDVALSNASLRYSKGSALRADDFLFVQEPLAQYTTRTFSPPDGRSTSGDYMPYFNLCGTNEGFFAAIGWSGQWEASFRRTADSVHVTAGMQNTHFVLYPNESVRTPSFALLKWSGREEESYGIWRAHMLAQHTPKDENGDPVTLPISVGAWGGDADSTHLNTIQFIAGCNYDYDAYWIDAGWYGDANNHSADQYGEEWFKNAGDWYHNTSLYPNGLLPISNAAHNAGMDFLLWFEPERAWWDSQLATEHPQWFLKNGVTTNTSYLLNLGDSAACQWITNYISQKLQEYGADIYRQDFNLEPLAFWRANDAADRQGITEMKYIEGLYAYFAGLLDQNPGILLDNCAGGGRRLDYEILTYSTVLFRSDYQCFPDYGTTPCQVQTDGLSHWVPLSGTATQNRPGDTYSFRSNLAAAMQTPATSQTAWQKAMLTQFHTAQQYFEGDYYRVSDGDIQSEADWYAYQMHRNDTNSGFVLAFRRGQATNSTEVLSIYVPDNVTSITFTDADTGASWTRSATLASNNRLTLTVTISNTLESKLMFYEMH